MTMQNKIFLMMQVFVLFLAFLPASTVLAEEIPLEIEADNSLEWDRNNHVFTAKGNAVVKRGDASVQADLLTANYTENEAGDITIQNIVATGKPKAVKGDDTITAEKLTAYLGANNQMERIEAERNVKISTPSESAKSSKAIYYFETERAVMNGDVVLMRGANLLFGAQAEFNLKTNVAKLSSPKDSGGGGRVRGVFYTEKTKSSAGNLE